MLWVCILILAAVWIVCGIAHGGLLGIQRKNNAAAGVGLAMWAGPFSALFTERIKDKRRFCPWCGMAIPVSAEICPWCDEWVNGRPRVVEIGPDVVIIETRRVEQEDGDDDDE